MSYWNHYADVLVGENSLRVLDVSRRVGHLGGHQKGKSTYHHPYEEQQGPDMLPRQLWFEGLPHVPSCETLSDAVADSGVLEVCGAIIELVAIARYDGSVRKGVTERIEEIFELDTDNTLFVYVASSEE
jgi:hypothetical protein